MLFTMTAKVAAYIILIVGVITVFMGFTDAAAKVAGSGEAIDHGFIMLFAALVLGVLSEISSSLKK